MNNKYPEIDNLLNQLRLQMQEVLGDKLIGLYLYGSLVWGDFDYEISDLDLLAVLSSDVDENKYTLLKAMHESFEKKYKDWHNRIEVQYISKHGLKTFKTEPCTMAVISPGEPLHIITYVKEYLMNFYFVQEQGFTLFGSNPKTYINSISKTDFLKEVIRQAKRWRTHVEDTKSSSISRLCYYDCQSDNKNVHNSDKTGR